MTKGAAVRPVAMVLVWLGVLLCLTNSAALGQQSGLRSVTASADNEFKSVLTSAHTLVQKRRYDEAIRAFNRAAGLRDGQCAECFQGIGEAQLAQTKYYEASVAFKQAIALDPPTASARLLNAYGLALYRIGHPQFFNEAVQAFERTIELSGGKEATPYYYLGSALIKQGRLAAGIEALKTYLALNPAAPEAHEVRALMANPKLINEPFAPGFRLTSLTGEPISLERYRGKVVLLDFWATWCFPCQVEMPELKRLWKQYGGDKFVILGVSLDDDRATLDRYLKQQGITWPQYHDGKLWDNKLAQLFKVTAIPQTVLIDQDGVLRAVGLRSSMLARRIEELLKPKPAQPGLSRTAGQ